MLASEYMPMYELKAVCEIEVFTCEYRQLPAACL